MTKAKTPVRTASAPKASGKTLSSESLAAKAKAKVPASNRDFEAMSRGLQATQVGRTSGTSVTKSNTPKTSGNALVQGQNADALGAGIDLEQLADLLAKRMSGSKALADAITPVGSCGSGEIVNGRTPERTLMVGSQLRPVNPVDQEFTSLDSNVDELNNLIDDLNGALEPVLAYEQVADEIEGAGPTKDSESPNHRRLINLNERMSNVIHRLRYMRSRIRN